MNAVRVQTTVEADGELLLSDLPCRRGDKVEANVSILEPSDGKFGELLDELKAVWNTKKAD